MYCFLIPINLRSFYTQFCERFAQKLTIANYENANDKNGGEYYSIANIIPIIHDIVISLFPSQISTSLFSDLSLVCFCVVGVRERGASLSGAEAKRKEWGRERRRRMTHFCQVKVNFSRR